MMISEKSVQLLLLGYRRLAKSQLPGQAGWFVAAVTASIAIGPRRERN